MITADAGIGVGTYTGGVLVDTDVDRCGDEGSSDTISSCSDSTDSSISSSCNSSSTVNDDTTDVMAVLEDRDCFDRRRHKDGAWRLGDEAVGGIFR